MKVKGLNTMCYAYRKCSDVKVEEHFYTHSLEVAECIENSWELEGVKRKVKKIYGVDEKLVGDFVVLAGLLHDIGKIDEGYQKKCINNCTEFPNHYTLSAMLALRLGYEVNELGLSPDNIESILNRLLQDQIPIGHESIGYLYLALVVFPILLHHYAQIRSEYSILNAKSLKPTLKPSSECIYTLTKIISDAKRLVSEKTSIEILNILTRNLGEEIQLSVIPLSRLLHMGATSMISKHITMLIECAVGIVNMCDGRIASKNRSLKGAKTPHLS